MKLRTRRRAAKTCVRCPPRRTRSMRASARDAAILVTFGELVEVVASVTADLAEQIAVLDHVLRGSREDRSAMK